MKSLWVAIVTVFVVAVTGCAADDSTAGSAGPGSPVGPSTTEPPADAATGSGSGEVFAQGTVLQVGDAPPQLCLGPIMESYPPQCGGPEVVGWNWATVEQSESASGITWGGYAVQGTWDGTRLTVTQPPIPLSLFDPIPNPDPYLDEANAGSTSDAQLANILNEVSSLGLPGFVNAWSMNGYVFVDVVFEIEAVQSILNSRYGPEVAQVRAAIKPIS